MKKTYISSIMGMALLAGGALLLTGCSQKAQAAALTDGLTPGTVAGKETDESFRTAQYQWAAKLFLAAADETRGENLLVSPLSVQLALAMAGNGAQGDTLTEMETMLGGIALEELNGYLYTYTQNLSSEEGGKLELANSIWIRDLQEVLTVNQNFLQLNVDYFNAQIYKAPFDEATVKAMNQWVKDNTGGLITEIVQEIPAETMLYLLNGLVLDAEWETIYKDTQVGEMPFTNWDGSTTQVKMLESTEGFYLEGAHYTGFLKAYKGEHYFFGAILPEEGMDVYTLLEETQALTWWEELRSPQEGSVQVRMPKFTSATTLDLVPLLKSLGMETAFDTSLADFSPMGSSSLGNLYLGSAIHKTYIRLDEKGTKAGAVTSLGIETTSAIIPAYTVWLDRPFVYFIVDGESRLPIFTGVMTMLE